MAAFLFGAVLQPAACGSGKFAATMHLIRTEATVGVSDVDGSALASWAIWAYTAAGRWRHGRKAALDQPGRV